jgi:WbqC-like protein family
MNCVILQPSYIPWRGYFHQIYKADVFVFYDDVQYDKQGWRNRNRIRAPGESKWLSIPVLSKGSVVNSTLINEIQVYWNREWTNAHLGTIKQFYAKSPYLQYYRPLLEEFYSRHPKLLADFTIDLTIELARELGINNTTFVRSSSLGATGSKTDRLVNILKAVGATHYISGPSARDYLEEDKLQAAGISLEYIVYDYPEYQQLYPPFDPYVSVIDLLLMTGPHAHQYIWGSPVADTSMR